MSGHDEREALLYLVFSTIAFIILHLFMYGCNLFMWNKTKIDHNSIFGFQLRTALRVRDILFICMGMVTSTAIGAIVTYLSGDFSISHVNAIPLILLVIFLAMLVNPFDICYRSTRYYFLRVIGNIVCSPFSRVLMVDIFMADQLTSQIPLLRHIASISCYFVVGSFKTHPYKTCTSGKLFREVTYVISFAPYYCRAMQCGRRWFEDRDPNHLINMGKYVSTMVAAGTRITYGRQHSKLWRVIMLVTSIISTLYQLYWDLIKDWGLFNPKSKNRWLRDHLIFKRKIIYYVSMVINFVLRVAWMETIFRFESKMNIKLWIEFLLASLEIIRRGHWNFYRLENEHLKNSLSEIGLESGPESRSESGTESGSESFTLPGEERESELESGSLESRGEERESESEIRPETQLTLLTLPVESKLSVIREEESDDDDVIREDDDVIREEDDDDVIREEESDDVIREEESDDDDMRLVIRGEERDDHDVIREEESEDDENRLVIREEERDDDDMRIMEGD